MREINLNQDKKLIQDCVGKEYCSDRIQALERLTKAKKDLKFYNLNGANLYEAKLENANLEHANLSGANLNGTYLYNAKFWDINYKSLDALTSGLGVTYYILMSTCNWEKAIFVEAYDYNQSNNEWTFDKTVNQRFIEGLKPHNSQEYIKYLEENPQEKVDCSKW